MRYVLLLIFFLLFRLIIFYLFPLDFVNGQHVVFHATLFEDPIRRSGHQEFSLHLSTLLQGARVLVVANTEEQFVYGQELQVNGTISKRLLKNKQIVITIQNAKIKAKNDGFLPFFGIVRGKIIDFCENNFSQPYSGLIVGIIFGIKTELTQEVTRSFRITGLSHVVAASGMNVALVAGFLFSSFSLVLRRQEATVCSILGIFLYVCLSGFDASIVRAALMGGVAFSAPLFGRQYSGFYILLLTAILILLWNPLLLVDVGFQLSFLATAGILLLKPILFGSNFFLDDIGTTLSAQIATLPVLLANFGQYSLLSLIANILILWTIPLIMIVGGVGIVIGLLFEPLGRMIVSLILPLVWYLQQVTNFFSNHPLAVSVSQLPIIFSIGYYCFLGGFMLFIKKRRAEKLEIS